MTPTWTLSKEFRFEAAHFLPLHDGKCKRLHGHSWVMRVTVVFERLEVTGPKSGMGVDFGDIKSIVQPIVDAQLDHYCLNDTLPLANPTSEEVARWVHKTIETPLMKAGAVAVEVEIDETCTSSCRYSESAFRGLH